jgi:hypothetical protein
MAFDALHRLKKAIVSFCPEVEQREGSPFLEMVPEFQVSNSTEPFIAS